MTDLIFLVKDTFPQAAHSPELLLGAGLMLGASLFAYAVTRSKECLVCAFATVLYLIPLLQS